MITRRFDPPLVAGTLERRYKRFLSDVALDDGRRVVAHCPSPGSMAGLAEPGSRVWLSPSTNPKRKLRWTWELATDSGVLVAFDGQRSNGLVAQLITAARVPELVGYTSLRREVRCGARSRIDLLLEGHPDDPRPCWIEVKTVTLGGDDGVARFPDAKTERGRRHLEQLAARVAAGDRAVIFFLAQRADAVAVAAADAIDPAYAETLTRVRAAGVQALAWRAIATPEAITLDAPLPVLGP